MKARFLLTRATAPNPQSLIPNSSFELLNETINEVK